MTALRGATALIGLAVKRDRFRLPTYVLGPAVLMAGMVGMWKTETHQALVEEVELFARTPALRIFGVVSGVSIGSAFMTRGYVLLAVLAALTSALAVVRHTRQNEETGRAELAGSAVVGRHAGLAAAVSVTVAANLVLALVLAIVGIASGLPTTGSFAVGVAVGGFGTVFAGVAAVTAQLSSTTRGASGLAAAVLGLAFAVGGIGNMLGSPDATGHRVESAWPAWLSPMSWGQQMRPFGGDIWWPVGLFVVTLVVLVGAASALESRRDVGSGILAERRGRAEAGRRLVSPLGLAWRLQRGALLAWAAALAGFGLVFGAIVNEVKDTGGATADWYARMTGSDQMVEAWGTSMVEMTGMVVAIYAVQILLRLRSEEADGPAESILATAVSRPRWVISHVINTGLGALVLLLVFTVSMGLAAGIALDDVGGQLRSLVAAGLVQWPGIMAIGAVVVAVTSLLPRWAGAISWTAVVVAILLGPLFGAATFQLPQSAQDLSPFTHIPKAPAAEITATPVLSLLAVAALLTLAGLVAFRRRSLVLPA